MMKRNGSVWITLGLLLIAAALFLTGWNLLESQNAGNTSTAVISRLEENLPSAARTEITPVVTEPEHPPVQQNLPDFIRNPDLEMPVETIDGNEYIGVLEIPSQGLELPVVSRENTENLRKGPCRYAGSAYTNNLVIAGHNYRQHFGPVRDLRYGDVIRLTDLDGNVFRYEVVDMETTPRRAWKQ